jgi:hypothetical protein
LRRILREAKTEKTENIAEQSRAEQSSKEKNRAEQSRTGNREE